MDPCDADSLTVLAHIDATGCTATEAAAVFGIDARKIRVWESRRRKREERPPQDPDDPEITEAPNHVPRAERLALLAPEVRADLRGSVAGLAEWIERTVRLALASPKPGERPTPVDMRQVAHAAAALRTLTLDVAPGIGRLEDVTSDGTGKATEDAATLAEAVGAALDREPQGEPT